MMKEEPLNTSEDLQELQRKLSLLIESLQSKVVAFMKSPVGQFLNRHPFLALILLEFIAVSAIPIGFFLLLVVLTSMAAFVGVILLEGPIRDTVIVAIGWSTRLFGHSHTRGRMFAMQPLPRSGTHMGLVISVGGLALLCVLCGLGFMLLAMLGTVIVPYIVISSLVNYWFSSRPLTQQNSSGDCQPAMKSANLEGFYQE